MIDLRAQLRFLRRHIKNVWEASPSPRLSILAFAISVLRQRNQARRVVHSYRRFSKMPRYTPATAQLYGHKFKIVDADSFLDMCNEILVRQNYQFPSAKREPLIIDCGANIGVSVYFFKMQYPDARIIAFEPDPSVFRVLEENVRSLGLRNVVLHNVAVWKAQTELEFIVERSWGGRLRKVGEADSVVKVPSVRLRDFLDEPIEFLKIDIEGAEMEVIRDCHDSLAGVRNLFVEYHSFRNEQQLLGELLTFLAGSGFRYYIKEASRNRLPFVDRPQTPMDLQVEIFCYRVN